MRARPATQSLRTNNFYIETSESKKKMNVNEKKHTENMETIKFKQPTRKRKPICHKKRICFRKQHFHRVQKIKVTNPRKNPHVKKKTEEQNLNKNRQTSNFCAKIISNLLKKENTKLKQHDQFLTQISGKTKHKVTRRKKVSNRIV